MSNQVTFEEMNAISGFEIETEFPHRIRDIKTKNEVQFKKTANGVIARLNLKNVYVHTLVAQQWLEYKDGMIIKFLDNDSSNYDVWNLDVGTQVETPVENVVENEGTLTPTVKLIGNKISRKRVGKLIDLDDNFLFDNITKKNYIFDGILNEKSVLKENYDIYLRTFHILFEISRK